MIPHRAFFILGLLSLPAGSSGKEDAKKVNGILGESVTFPLKTSVQLTKIYWLRNNVQNFVLATPQKDPEETCKLHDQIREYRGRLNASEDCKRLQINNLVQEDSGTYTAQIWTGDDSVTETFVLRVYKGLLEDDLSITCDREEGSSGGNGTLRLNCSAGKWEKDVTFTWVPASQKEPTGKSLVIRHNLEGNDLSFTCTAQNPVSTASKTVSLRTICSGSSGEEDAEKVNGILGESVTFPLKTSVQLTKIFWLRTNVQTFVLATPQKDPEETCKLSDQIREYRGRLNASEDCKRLQINNLVQEDSGTYTAQIRTGDDSVTETFVLRVYKGLLEDDLSITCDREEGSSGGNGTLRLNCSAGKWEKDVTFTWVPASQKEPTGKSLVIRHNLEGNDLSFTCTAQNPVSTASKTVSLRTICSGEEACSNKMHLSTLAAILTVEKVAISVCAGIFMWWKKQRGDATDPKVK